MIRFKNREKSKKLLLSVLFSWLALIVLFSLPGAAFTQNAGNNPFAEGNIDIDNSRFDSDYLDGIDGIIDIDEEIAETRLETATEITSEINDLIEEIEKILADVNNANANQTEKVEEVEEVEETAEAAEAVEEKQENETKPQNAVASEEQKLINEIRYGYRKTEEKLKAQQKPESIIASMKYTKKYADQLKLKNPGNQWVATSIDFLTRTITNQIKYGTARLANKSGATATWLSSWLKGAKDMNLPINQDVIEKAENALKLYHEQTRNQPALASNQRGGKVLKVPMRNQRLNSVGPAWSCGPTSLGMAMEYLGKKVSSVQLISDCGTNRNGTDHAGMVRGAKKNGFSGARWVYGQSAAWVRSQIDAGKPVVVNVPNHYMVCIGYDSRGYLIFNDPNGGRELIWSPSHFEANWVHGHAALILQ